MRRRGRRALFPVLALVLLASMGALLAEESLVHTDDGCQVEVHCLACRLALATSVVPAAAPVPLPLPQAADPVETGSPLAFGVVRGCLDLSRGPPLAS